jgi:hypothetical protein
VKRPMIQIRSFSVPLSRALFAFALAGAILTGQKAEAESVRDVLGSTHAAGKYSFTNGDYLNEGANQLLDLGTRVIKVWLPYDGENFYPFHSEWDLPSKEVYETLQRPYYQALFEKPFNTYILEVVTNLEVFFVDGMDPEEVEAERNQSYRIAKYLLTTYSGSGKTFVLQNWEGDHMLRQGMPEEGAPDAVRIQGLIDFFNARQDGVDQARNEVGQKGVEVYHAIEVNHLGRAMKGQVTATNNVVPFTHADLYSYSSWDIGFDKRKLVKALDYLAAKAPNSRAFGAKNIYLGEFGVAKDHLKRGQTQRGVIKGLTEAALGWGVRWALYWQLYCNEPKDALRGRPKNGDMRGFWLIRPDGTKTPMWNDFKRFLSSSVQQVVLRSTTGQYLAPEGEAPEEETGENLEIAVKADRWTRGTGETFALWDWNGDALEDGDLVSLQAHDGTYLAAEPGQGGRLLAASSGEDEPETFVFKRLGRASMALQTSAGRFLGIDVDGDSALRALRWEAGPAETFQMLPGE